MILTIDIGNTNIALGAYHNNTWVKHWRIYTETCRTSDEYRVIIHNLLVTDSLKASEFTNIVISSVVPALTEPFVQLVQNLFGKEPLLITHDIETGLDRDSIPPEIGSDLLVNAAYAHYLYPDNICMVVDFGTALTFTTVSQKGAILGVAIAPGVLSAVDALSAKTAQLPHVAINTPPTVLGRNTGASIRAGVVFGYTGLVENIIKQTEKELGCKLFVIATGGLSHTIAPLVPSINEISPLHTIEGLRLCLELHSER